MRPELQLLVECGLIDPALSHATSRPRFPLDPDRIDALAELVERRLPGEVAAIAITETMLDAQLGYVLARSRNAHMCLLYDHEGIGHLEGAQSGGGTLALVTAVLSSEWLLREFDGLCRQIGIEPGPIVALVDWRSGAGGAEVASVVARRELADR